MGINECYSETFSLQSYLLVCNCVCYVYLHVFYNTINTDLMQYSVYYILLHNSVEDLFLIVCCHSKFYLS